MKGKISVNLREKLEEIKQNGLEEIRRAEDTKHINDSFPTRRSSDLIFIAMLYVLNILPHN
ncbi:phenylalanyl-tRNA synthetase subunit alpha [Pediococcus acidilactici D3]|nr:phenylalanyl-tRNA synthetase subunit alpha [Pediococcus acidilactici D3]